MNRKALYDLVAVVGAVILFLAWIFQQTVINNLDGSAASLTQAKRFYAIYQSHNALFNTIIATQTNRTIIKQIRTFQIYNYGLGLEDLAAASGLTVYADYNMTIDQIQAELQKMQERAATRTKQINSEKSIVTLVFTCVTGFGTLLTVLGSYLKIWLPEK
jgi:hypothetical protein